MGVEDQTYPKTFIMMSKEQAQELVELLERERELDSPLRFDRSNLGKLLACLKGVQ